MPKMNGKEAYDEIKKIDPAVKAIFMSGHTADIIHKHGLMDESIQFLAKPLNPKKLLVKVRNVLDGGANEG
jgi:DNA-binding response OmpR family regulator